MNNNHSIDSEPEATHSHLPRHTPVLKGPSLLLSVLLFLVMPIAIALFLTAFVIQSYQVDGQSMQNTLNDHDRLLVDKIPRTIARIRHSSYVPNRGDIVIFN